ncbi:MAG: PD40 domain-containing protein [Bacteroidetes bacterium]|nr:PD40 domain-containing protein [Bacteroidota bacterium]
MFNIKVLNFSLFALFLIFIFNNKVISQFDPHPELEWHTIETKHFFIHYHDGTERTANTIAKIAEEVYGPITSLYKYEPDEKVNFIVNDVSDIANGATDYFGNRIEIYATALDYDLRGTHNWLRNVITHEFTHAVQVQASLKYGRKLPTFYLQWLGYENEIRPDVLYGYPNAIVSYPISGVGVPAWFAEGTAQYQRQQLNYEYWDAHRDMILRSYIIGGNLLSWGEMGQFSSITSLKAESIYNLGYALTRYIADKYGEDKLAKITEHLGDFINFSMDRAVKEAIGIDGKELYNQWKAYLEKDYKKRLADVKPDEIDGVIIENKGFANYYPQLSPDGKKIAYLSNQDYDFGATSLFIYDLSTKKSEFIFAPVGTNFSWSPDSKKILYAKRNYPRTILHSTVYDIYEYDVKSKEEKKLTDKLRASYPSYSPDGKEICFVINGDGTLNLYTADASGKNIKALTLFNNGEQIYNPKFTKDGKKIIFDYAFEEARKLAEIDIETGNMEFILDQKGIDYRTPFFSQDGKKLYFSSNPTGIFNIYSMDLDSGKISQITNVEGGAFMPSVDGNGNIVYSTYKPTGYKIALLKNFQEKDPASLGKYKQPDILIARYNNEDSLKAGSNFNWNKLKNFNDRDVPVIEKKPYKSLFTSLSFVPVIRFDTYKRKNKLNFIEAIKPGLYFFSNEMLNRFSVFGGATINIKGERDLFLQFLYDNGFPFFKDFFTKKVGFLPTLTLEGYNTTRKSDGDLIAGADTINVGITYDLLSFDFGMAFNIINDDHKMKFGYTLSNYAYDIDAFAIPESGISVRSSRETYFKAHDLSLTYNYENILPGKNSDINPIGRKLDIRYDYELSKINPSIVVNDNGTITTNYENRNLHKLSGSWTESIGLFNNKHSVSLRLSGGTIFGPPVEDFYNFYASGLPGMRGYPFYSIGGGRAASVNLTYRLPLISKIDTRISPMYLDKLYFSLYGDFGNAWNGSDTKLSDFKKDIGAQLRLQAFSFYVFPTSIFFDVAYGFDRFSNVYQNTKVTYGREFNYYLGVLFGFDI